MYFFLVMGVIYFAVKIRTSAEELVKSESKDLMLFIPEQERQELLNEEDDFQQEIEKYDAPLSTKKTATVFFRKGYKLLKQKEYDGAIEHLRLSYQNIKTGSSAFYIGRSYSEKNMPTEAIKWFQISFELHLLEENKARALMNAGVAYTRLNKHTRAIKLYERATKMSPHDYMIWFNKGVALKDIGKHLDAKDAFQEALRHNNEYYQARLNLGACLNELGQYKKAIQIFNKILSTNENYALALHNKGFSLQHLGDFSQALAFFTKATLADTSCYLCWFGKANAHKQLGEYKKAIQSYKQAVRLKPNLYQAWHNLATTIEFKLQDADAAIPYYEKFLESAPRDDPNYIDIKRSLKRYKQANKNK